MSHDVFISHSSLDKLAADAICHGLEAKGIRCWIAPRDQTAGQPYGQQITQAIENADVMVLVFSDHVNQSQAVLNEINVAAGANVTIVPFRIASVEFNSELHFYLGRMHWLDAFPQPVDAYIDTLADTVRRNVKSHAAHAGNGGGAAAVAAAVVEAPPAPPAPPPPPPAPPPPPPTPPPPPPAPPPPPVAPPLAAAGALPYGAAPPGAAAPYIAPSPGAQPPYGAAGSRPKTDLRPLMIAGGVFGVIAFIVLIVAVAPHPPPTPSNTTPAPVVVANNTPPAPGPNPAPPPAPPPSDQVPMGDGTETKPVQAANTQQVTQYETEVTDTGPPATLEGAAVINTSQLVQSMTDRDAGNAPFWLIDARGCSGEQSIPTAVCFAGYAGTNTAPNFQTMIAAIEAKIPDKKAELVIFCHDGGCPYSYELASAALTAGYENIFWYRGGINAWAAAGMPTASDQQQQ